MSWLSKLLQFDYKQASASGDSRPTYAATTPISSYRSWLWTAYGDKHTAIDYAAEVGSMEASSLFASAVNFVGACLAEPNPALVTEVDGEKEYDYDAEIVKLLRRPNPYFIWADYALMIAEALLDDGNCYFKKTHAGSGRTTELWPLPYHLVEPRFLGDHKRPDVPEDEVDETNRFLSHFQYNQPQADPVLYKASDIVHLKRGMNKDFPQKGVGVFRPLVTEVYGDKAAALFTSTIMRNMGMVPWLVAPKKEDDSMTDTQAAAFKEQWEKASTGDNVGRPMINTIPLDVTKLGFNPQELDLSSMRAMFESRVAAVTGIPAAVLQFKVGQENGTSYASYEEARKQAYYSCIIPLLSHLQEDFTFQLLSEFSPKENQYIEFNTDEVQVLQQDEDALFKRAGEALKSGGITLDEYRAMIGQEPLGDGVGDLHFVPALVNPQTAEQMMEEPEPVPNAPVPPVIDPALAKLVDMDRYLESLESQMAAFKP